LSRNHPTLNSLLSQPELAALTLHARGKVRDIYEAGDDLLFIASDRISAFDHILPTLIPDKGKVLTQLSLFWFDFLRDVVPNHLITKRLTQYPEPLRDFVDQLRGRSMLVRRAKMFPVECVARGYLSGSGWKEYQQAQAVCGIQLPAGLRESDRLPEPIFTPATKSSSGHDANIPFTEMVSIVGRDSAEKLRDLTLRIYLLASEHAKNRGIIIADTKFEFGVIDGSIALADEVLTPDSSRFWPAESYRPGGPQLSYDKQFVRDYLESIRWDKNPPAPALPDHVVQKTREKYIQALSPTFRQGARTVTLLDWVIFGVILLSIFLSAAQGFFYEIFSLAGVVLGFLSAVWGYHRLSSLYRPYVNATQYADIAAFLTIFFAVLIFAGMVARLARWAVKEVGLSWIDRLLGGAFGLVRGVAIVTVGVLAIAAFAPDNQALARSSMGGYFPGSRSHCDLGCAVRVACPRALRSAGDRQLAGECRIARRVCKKGHPGGDSQIVSFAHTCGHCGCLQLTDYWRALEAL
jgi:phosphoribosylaminoimidazole-succinocarboxamide synthase